MPNIIVNSLGDLSNAAELFCKSIGKDRIFAFYGNMGAGKTTFIKEICSNLGVVQDVTSPSFSIVNEYICKKYPVIFHFDFYRIEKTSEIYDIGFEEYLIQNALIFIEWPEKLGELLPIDSVSVKILQSENLTRNIIW
ncbi:MAG TPA: tRNA (adenosine(37)-N6)-threonylcarbamoyltransferase complex ATPase subunit type 1 TsaE [Bacteroidales bacterium]|nr:tRNA (adenosine(37)-N6)-threonylcarbamoyltransferase complex ATPase subunit type 1 TsaE [Bacteroidales bacterium]